MKALVVGLGSIGTRHLNNLSALGVSQLSALRTRNHSVRGDIPASVSFFFDYDEILENPPDIVVIANPTSMHSSYAEKAIKAGCHVYLEKPVSDNLDDADRLLELMKNKDNAVQVGCQLRCHPQLLKIKDWVHSGKLGAVHSVVADVGEYLPDWHPWENYSESYAARRDLGGGAILTMIHEIDYLHWIFGPLSVQHALGGKRTSLEINVEDTVLLTLKSEDEIPIHLRMDYWRRPPERTLSIVGDKAQIFWDYHTKELRIFSKGQLIVEDKLPNDWDRNILFLEMMRDFYEAIKEKREVCSSLSDGVKILKLALSAKHQLDVKETKLKNE